MIKDVPLKSCHIYFNPSHERAKKNDLNVAPEEVFFLWKCPMQINGSISDKTLWTNHQGAGQTYSRLRSANTFYTTVNQYKCQKTFFFLPIKLNLSFRQFIYILSNLKTEIKIKRRLIIVRLFGSSIYYINIIVSHLYSFFFVAVYFKQKKDNIIKEIRVH